MHDRITRSALRILHIGSDSADDPVVREYLAGVRWSDDPGGLLEDAEGNPTNGAQWCLAFAAAQSDALHGRPARSLLARSHFGDLQVLHSMAPRRGMTSRDTYGAAEPWVELEYRVAIGDIDGQTRLAKVPVVGLASRLAGLKGQTVNGLFGIKGGGDVKARALGVLLHYLQDALGDGHAARSRGSNPPITYYFTYARGIHGRHRGDTGWRTAWSADAPLESWPGSLKAIEASVDVIRLVQHQQPWSEARHHIDRIAGSYSDFHARAVPWREPK